MALTKAEKSAKENRFDNQSINVVLIGPHLAAEQRASVAHGVQPWVNAVQIPNRVAAKERLL
jgi:hypothetical protein